MHTLVRKNLMNAYMLATSIDRTRASHTLLAR